MGKLTRVLQKLFASTSGSTQIGVFGSLAAGSPQFAGSDAAAVQALPNFEAGWPGAVIGGNSPAIEDLNALCYLYGYQLAYMFQQGIPEYDGSTVYFQHSIVQDGSTGTLYQATYGSASGFSGFAPPNGTYWALLLGVATSTSQVGDFSTGSTSFVDTGLSIAVTTHGRPVDLLLSSGSPGAGSPSYFQLLDAGSSATVDSYIELRILRGSTAVMLSTFGVSGVSQGATAVFKWAPGLSEIDDSAPAGINTYKVQMRIQGGGGGAVASFQKLKFTVTERVSG